MATCRWYSKFATSQANPASWEDLIVATHKNVKTGLLIVALFALMYLGAGLLEGFLPYEWRHAIDQRFEQVFPSPVYAPHPDMYWEFELDFRQHPADRLFAYAVFGILSLGNAYLISRVWRAFRKSPTNIADEVDAQQMLQFMAADAATLAKGK